VARSAKTFRLRTYEPADFETLYEIDQLCYEPEIAYSRRELRAYLQYPGAQCVVALTRTARPVRQPRPKSKPAIIGFCVIAAELDYGYIVTIDVLEPWRRKGVGHALLVGAEKRAAARGACQIELDTATENSAAIAFWEKHGYRKLAVRRRYYPNGRDAYAMRKTLRQTAERTD
jgi:ribosomal-protein-alanine N-acetyltransferase